MGSNVPILKIFEENKLVKMCAPMVRYSKIQFRSLAREYDCDICYTPMIMADSFCRSEKARQNEFTTNQRDQPLVVQFAAKTVHDFVGAAFMVLPYSNGVELNCGCPQRWAMQDGYGCALLAKPELIADLIHQCRAYMSNDYTISAKIRLLNNVKETVRLCQRLEKSGVSYITVHGRTPTQKNEPVNTEAIKTVKESLRIPLVANGDIKSLEDAKLMQETTGCDGVMAARGMLANPAMFSGYITTPIECVQKWVDICYSSVYSNVTTKELRENHLQWEDLTFPQRHQDLTFQCFHHHLVFMIEKLLTKQQRQIFNNLHTFDSVVNFLRTSLEIKPKFLEDTKSLLNTLIHPSYNERDILYKKLFENVQENENNYNPDLLQEDGKFIKQVKRDANNISDDESYFISETFDHVA